MSEYKSILLSVDQWKQVLVHVEGAANSNKYMFILRCWANAQVVTNSSYVAFEGIVAEDLTDRTITGLRIGNITKWVKNVTGLADPTPSVYQWNQIKGEWTIGWDQCGNLRQALGFSKMPKGV
tara:strand:- start:1152 stop:1520 length:369 start_codon:yes stop_codon:yes gene_type:complete